MTTGFQPWRWAERATRTIVCSSVSMVTISAPALRAEITSAVKSGWAIETCAS